MDNTTRKRKGINGRSSLTLLAQVLTLAAIVDACSSDLLASPPSAVVVSLSAAPTATPLTNSATITWKTNIDATGSLEYGTSSGSYASATPQSTTAATDQSASIAGLAASTTYYYRVVSSLGNGRVFRSSEYSFATAAAIASIDTIKARGIWIIGGLSGSTINTTVGSLDMYDPVTNTWYPAVTTMGSTTLPSATTPVSFAGYAALNGKIYVIGGFDSGGSVQQSVQVYDVASDSWSVDSNPMPTARANIYATVLNGKIYIISGSQAAATTAWAGAPAPSGACYEYVPGSPTGTWNTKTGYTATNNTERFTYAYGNVIYSIGGRSSATAVTAIAHDGYIPSLSALTTATTELAMTTAPSVARTGVTGVVSKSDSYDDALVLIGGISTVTGTTGSFINSPTTASGTMSSLAQYLAYPFAAPSAWQNGSSYPVSIAFGAAAISSATGSPCIYYFGGTQSLGASAAGQASAYWTTAPAPPTAWTSSWTSTSAMPTGRWGHGAVTLSQ